MSGSPLSDLPPSSDDQPSIAVRLWRLLVGAPRNLSDRSLFHSLSLISLLAWVGLGADGLSSSAYGPEEAFRALGPHTYLAIPLAGIMTVTVVLISMAYSRIIEAFPHGGGGYVVASKTLGRPMGVISGCALLVDYVLTITVSIAAAGDALFSFVPLPFHHWKLPLEVFLIVMLMLLNLRGVRESVLVLAPVFMIFVVTHVAAIVAGILIQAPDLPATAQTATSGFSQGLASIGLAGLVLLLVHGYSLGGGTYTGIEAVSNGVPLMREPRVRTAKRTMIFMASSLAFTASGLLVCYLLWRVSPVEGKTLNAVLMERMTGGVMFGGALVAITIASEGALLVVAAQAGFIDGPRVLANMAIDSWMPHRLAALSDRLTTQNGILLMSAASMAALLYTGGNVQQLVVMYSINVFLTFSLSMLGMALASFRDSSQQRKPKRRAGLFISAFILCITILTVTVLEKFEQGGWLTLSVTGLLVLGCMIVQRHYKRVSSVLDRLYRELTSFPLGSHAAAPGTDPRLPTAIVLVSGYGGLGIHTTLNIVRNFPGHFKNMIFVSVAIIDSGIFKGEDSLASLAQDTEAGLLRYVELARGLGIAAASRFATGTDVVHEAEKLCQQVAAEFPNSTVFAGKVIFQRERWYQGLLHNETAFSIQKRMQWRGQPMVILPARVTLDPAWRPG